jgi:hypothetical protein
MSWGSRTPCFLVLGVSKGTTQCEALNTKPHDRVPFDGFRPKLTAALQLLGLLTNEETIEDKIHMDEPDWAFGSMVRCALGLVDAEDGTISRSGTVVHRLAQMQESESWLTLCSSVFLSRLPDRLRLCVLLSNDDRYIEATRRAITRLRPMTRPLNSVAYGDEQITWVHIVHVGGPGRNHIDAWIEGRGLQGQKRVQAQMAVARTLGRPVPTPIEASKNTRAERQAAERSAGEGGDTKPSARPVSSNPIRDAILARIAARSDVEPHASQKHLQGTKYISAFCCSRGATFAVDKMSATKQPLWMLDTASVREALDQRGILYEVYLPERARNSNLHKLPGFKADQLIRAYPETADEAIATVDELCKEPC